VPKPIEVVVLLGGEFDPVGGDTRLGWLPGNGWPPGVVALLGVVLSKAVVCLSPWSARS